MPTGDRHISLYAVAEHRISGDILCIIDSETLKGVGVQTIGQRLAILKAIYQLKLAHNIPLDADDYVPPCQSFTLIQQRLKLISPVSRSPGAFREFIPGEIALGPQ